ncbi:MAG: aconitate hydratase [Candidatus Scalindua sp. AMX11]|nr:MAG: aconitate hydratase [Candidatus Scalindua sp.]NOG85288.1 aconitate hydratase [Planctomycetota bacterium]RZV81493.1 MAG: aconitate hydratase [Candidatus Scalindua sp. SCAELEC01]TDE65434.1 MAG: aconitate hydratase [Candidatus Scalindua sp. AMX11]GJQ59356.1 MAG: aconitate hydratase [Candidatus Scalindua sp.]
MSGKTLSQKILERHLVKGKPVAGEEIGIRIDQTITQDATGTMVYLEFEKMGIERVRTELSVSYVDHNLLQTDFRNMDDHLFLQTLAAKYGVFFSKPGNGISHQVHFERFGIPGKTLLGSDSHTCTGGALGMLAIGAGGLDVATAMAGEPYYLKYPRIFGVKLRGKLQDWVSGKDVILEMLRRHSVKGGVGYIIEYFGPGVGSLSATDRATIANMGAELGATTSLFPSDNQTKRYLQSQGRGDIWLDLKADQKAEYDKLDEINLSTLEPLIACPSSPDNVKKVKEVAGETVHQCIVGSSVNSSFRDLMIVCKVLENKTVHDRVSFEINPGSRQVLENVTAKGGMISLLNAGVKIQQSGCLGCIGIGQAPASGTVSLRTFPRNFPGRSGTKDDRVYLCSPETAAAAGIFGEIRDPRDLGIYPRVLNPKKYIVNDSMIIPPVPDTSRVEIIRGPNIVPFPDFEELPESLECTVILKVGDNITTDHIMPAGNAVLPLRSNIPEISKFVYNQIDPGFPEKAKWAGNATVICGENYGQGSSREHAAIAPRYLGVRVKIAKSFARIHYANLINFGIIPLVFENSEDYVSINEGDIIRFPRVKAEILNENHVTTQLHGKTIKTRINLSERDRNKIVSGGLLNSIINKLKLANELES